MTIFKQTIDEIKKDRIKTYQILELDLSIERSNIEFNIVGNYIYVLSLNGSISFRFNELTNDKINLIEYRVIKTPFYRFFINNEAQIGKICKIAIGIETEFFEIHDFGINLTQNVIEEATGVAIYNVACTVANTEYSQNIGECRKFLVRAREGDLKLSFISGQSGTTYLTIQQNQGYWEDMIRSNNITFYFQSPTAGTVAEIVKWL